VTVVRCAAALLLAALVLPASASAFAGRNGTIVSQGKASAQRHLLLREPTGGPVRTITTNGRPSRPAFSAAGVRIAYAARGHIWVAQADGSFQRQLTTGFFDADPAWSPLGDSIVYTSGPAGGRDLFTIGLDGSGLRRLTSSSADEVAPTWSSRNLIAFVRITDGGDGDLWRTTPHGGARRLTKGPADDRDPAWSPDGRRIAFTRQVNGRREVYLANQLGHHVRRIRKLPGPASSPVFSPDGRWIAFLMPNRAKSNKNGIWRMRTNGKGLRQVAKPSTAAKAIDWQPQPGDPVVGAAGDIACDPSSRFNNDGFGFSLWCHQLSTSDELLKMDLASVFMLGDGQYEDSTLPKIMQSFDPTWGRLKPIMHPVIGNHEYLDPGAAGYFDYFNGPGQANGPAGARSEGWYSLDIGTWHVVVLNSNCDIVSCAPGGPEEQWLRADLAAHPARCTLALMHHPPVASGTSDEGEGASPMVTPLWQALYDGGADVILSGHEHAYERFAPLNPQGQPDPARGMRLFIVGTGGKNLGSSHSIRVGSETRQGVSFGVIQLALHPTSYDWRFVPDTPGGFTDAGSSPCH
jgi:acid phosphatase type 7